MEEIIYETEQVVKVKKKLRRFTFKTTAKDSLLYTAVSYNNNIIIIWNETDGSLNANFGYSINQVNRFIKEGRWKVLDILEGYNI